jgi:hypothetical protein
MRLKGLPMPPPAWPNPGIPANPSRKILGVGGASMSKSESQVTTRLSMTNDKRKGTESPQRNFVSESLTLKSPSDLGGELR